MSRIVKIGWFWNAVNDMVVQQFSRLPVEKTMTVHLENFDYAQYHSIAEWIGFKPVIKKPEFMRLAKDRPNTNRNKHHSEIIWSEKDYLDFTRVVEPMAERLGYPYGVDELKRKKLAQNLAVQKKTGRYRQQDGYSGTIFSKMGNYIKNMRRKLLHHE
jgi:hypothetical protein